MKIIKFIFIIILSLFLFTACNNTDTPEEPDTDPDEGEIEEKFEYDAPVLTLNDSTVSWNREIGSIQYEISINGFLERFSNARSEYYLTESAVVKLRILDYDGNPVSDWSNEVTYTEPEPVYVTVTFVSPDGLFETFEKQIIVNSNATLPTPEVDGYTIAGWHLEEIYSEEVFLHFSLPSSIQTDTTMYAHFKPNDYKLEYNDYDVWVEFISEGKRVDMTAVDKYSPKLTYPPQPKRDGYIFTGWYTDEECTKFYSPDSYLIEDITLYAGWYPESKLMYPNRLNDANYDWELSSYLSWDLEKTMKVYSSASILAPVRLSFTVWEQKTYTLQYRIKNFNSGCTLYLIDEMATNGKYIAKVYPDFSTTSEEIVFEGVPGRVYSICLFDSKNEPEIELKIPESCPERRPSTPNTLKVTYNEHFKLPTFEKENLQFYGYFTEKDGQGVQVTDADGNSLQPYNYASDMKIYPFYSEITYNINYEVNGGSLVDGNSFVTSFKEAELPISLPQLTKPGCIFDGWYNNETFEGDAITSIESITERTITLYAKFTEIDYTLNTYLGKHYENPTLVNEQTINYNDLYALSTDIEKGYKIDRYYYLENGTEISIDQSGNYLFEKNLDLYIDYSPIEYKITYHTNDGTLLEGSTLKETYNITETFALPILHKDNYVFEGWYDNENFDGEKIESVPVGTTEELEFYAKFSPRQYKISVYFGRHNSYEPALIEEISLYYNEEYRFNKSAVEGYTITGYYYMLDESMEMSLDAQGSYDFTDDLKVYTFYDVIVYDITYHMNDGILNSGETLVPKYNITSYVPLPNLNKEGYVFEGWYDNAEFTGNAYTAINSGKTGNLDLYAKFAQYKFKITVDNSQYNLEDFELEVIYSLDYSLNVTKVEGATFKGYYTAANGEGTWLCDDNGNSMYPYDYMEDITLYPYYEAEQFVINYYYPGGALSFDPVRSYTVFDGIIELPSVSYLSLKFLGWYTDSEFKSEPLFQIDSKTMQFYQLYARCEEVYYNCHIVYENIEVIYDLQYDDKKIIQTIDYETGKHVFEPIDNPVRDGYIFAGWYKTPECGDNDTVLVNYVPTRNMTVYAKWIEISSDVKENVYEIVHVDFKKYSADNPFTYTISENCTEDKPTLFYILTYPEQSNGYFNIRGNAEVTVSVGSHGWDNNYYEDNKFTLSSEYATTSTPEFRYTVVMVYVYGNGTSFDIDLYLDGMMDYTPRDVCNKVIPHNDVLQVFDSYGDYVLEGIYSEPNGQGELLSSSNYILGKYLYEGIVIYPKYVLKTQE